jgi:cholera toxin transcriptional activator
VLFPALFVLDMLWALAPFMLADRIGLGLALGSTAALIYMPFAQRTLVKMMQA